MNCLTASLVCYIVWLHCMGTDLCFVSYGDGGRVRRLVLLMVARIPKAGFLHHKSRPEVGVSIWWHDIPKAGSDTSVMPCLNAFLLVSTGNSHIQGTTPFKNVGQLT